MERRSAVLLGLVLLSAIVGFVWFQDGSCRTPHHIGIETQYTKHSVLSEAGSTELGPIEANENRHAILTDADEAQFYLENGSAAEAFGLETDFSASYVLIIIAEDSSSPRLQLRCLQREDDGDHVVKTTFTHTSGPRTDDIRTHSLLVRITSQEEGSPKNVTVEVSGHEPEPILPV